MAARTNIEGDVLTIFQRMVGFFCDESFFARRKIKAAAPDKTYYQGTKDKGGFTVFTDHIPNIHQNPSRGKLCRFFYTGCNFQMDPLVSGISLTNKNAWYEKISSVFNNCFYARRFG
jgi:hypothetical protein